MELKRKQELLKIIEMARNEVINNRELSIEYAKILFPPERKEYELTYYGKETPQQIINQTYAAPLQMDRQFGYTNKNNWMNKIVFGDNLQILKGLIDKKRKGELLNEDGSNGIKLIYIDPPFATRQDFQSGNQKAYSDKLKGAEFLEWLRKRLILLRELLSSDGVIYVHLDWRKVHYIKVLMDEIFGEGNFLNEIIWNYGTYVGRIRKSFPKKHDTILVYGKSGAEKTFYPQHDGKPENDANYKRWKNYFNKDNQITGANYPENDSKFAGYIERFIKKNNREPEENDVLLTVHGKLVDSVWYIQSVNPRAKERVAYPTQKPEELLHRIISASSNKGDIVLDAFGGSGTTAVVAEKLNRRWIISDIGKLSIYTIQKRIINLPKYEPFAVYNAGLYDNKKLESFDQNEWKNFAMSLWNIEPAKDVVKGIIFDGWKNAGRVKVYTPQEIEEIGGFITEDTIKDLYDRLGSSVGSEIFIVAPRGKFAFASDELDGNGEWDVVFYILRIPNSMTEKFTDEFRAQIQASDNDSVNDAIDAVGFDFIRPPEVKFEIKNDKLFILDFNAEARIRGKYEYQGFEAFSMLLIDYSYDGKVFEVDDVFYRNDFKNQIIEFPEKRIKKQAMLIFIDKFGNEFKVIHGG